MRINNIIAGSTRIIEESGSLQHFIELLRQGWRDFIADFVSNTGKHQSNPYRHGGLLDEENNIKK